MPGGLPIAPISRQGPKIYADPSPGCDFAAGGKRREL
jgi:hypothetical protein